MQDVVNSLLQLWYTALHIPQQEPLLPYKFGFVPNVQGDVLKQIIEQMGAVGSMGETLGFYSDLKVSTDDSNPIAKSIMERNAGLFVKSIMFHAVLNSYCAACGDIQIRISMPSDQFLSSNKKAWIDAKQYIEYAFIPEGSVTVGAYTTEATALFYYVNNETPVGISKYSAITDGGDGTYDFTINTFEKGRLVNPQALSLQYAGQQIMTDSINVFYDHMVQRKNGNVTKIFTNLWRKENNPTADLDNFVKQFVQYRGGKARDPQKEKTLVLTLVEQFGIDYQKLINPNPKNYLDMIQPAYRNLVRIVQYKFLFLFNVFGEQVRKNIHFDQEMENAFTIFLYGGTAQALALAEPLCNGDIGMFETHGSNFYFVQLIKTVLHFPKNCHGKSIKLVFKPAKDTEKRDCNWLNSDEVNGGFHTGWRAENAEPAEYDERNGHWKSRPRPGSVLQYVQYVL